MPAESPTSLCVCRRCSRELPPDAVVCGGCHALVHAAELKRIAAEAKALESKGDFRAAGESWRRSLPLLPADSEQAAWIKEHIEGLDQHIAATPEPAQDHKWARKLGPLAPIAILLAKAKSLLVLFKLSFLLSLFAFMGFYWSLYGIRFGVGFALMILVHEMGHFVAVKRRGLPVDMPVFLPGFGAYVRWQALGVSAEERAAISLAGPLAGWIAAAACALLWAWTGDGFWAALARAGAWLNVLNLIPVWALDGGQAASVLSRNSRVLLLTFCLALWLFLGESVFFFLAAGAGWRLFTHDIPERPSGQIAAYFLSVVTLLAVVMRLMPGRGFGSP